MSTPSCCLCRAACTSDNAILLNGQWVCAACKPRYLDILKGGGSAPHMLGRDGDRVVMNKQARLPDLCLKCGEPSCQRLRRKMQWHHPALYLLIAAGVLVYAVVALCVVKKAEVEIPLCSRHLAKRRQVIAVTWGCVALFALLLVAGIATAKGLLVLLGFVSLIGGMVYAAVANAAGSPAKINDRFVWIKGAGKEFLAELPVCDVK